MDSRALAWARWYAALFWRRAGWQVCAALLALAAAALLAWQARHLAAQSVELRRDTEHLAALPPAQLAQAGTPLSAQRLAEFDNLLVVRDSLPEQLRLLFSIAARHGVQLARGEYRAVADPNAHLVRYQITLPAQADAAALQRFLLASLAQMPALMLENIALKRDNARSGQVEARLRLALLVRAS